MKSTIPLLIVLALTTGAGSIQTRDGKSIQGDIRLDDGALLVTQSSGGPELRIPLANIRRAVFSETLIEQPTAPGGGLPPNWSSQDIGPVYRKGSASCDAKGLFSIQASGWGAWGPEDSFHFVYRPFTGDGQIIAHFVKMDDSHGKLAVGIMIRETLAPDAPMAGTTLHPSGEVRFTQRVLRNAPDFQRAEDITPRFWLRLTRRGNLFSSYRSADGRYWELVDSRTVEMKSDTLIGLSAWTLANTSLGAVQLDAVTIAPGTPGASWFAAGDPLHQGIIFRDGSAQAGTIKSADENGVAFLRSGQQTTIPWTRIARLVFNPAPADPSIYAGRKGALLTSGDFILGEVQSIADRKEESWRTPRLYPSIRSTLFGTKSFETARELIAITVADPAPPQTTSRIRTADGSILYPKTIELTKSTLRADNTPIPNAIEIDTP